MSANKPEPDAKKFIKAATELQELKDTLEKCYVQIVEKKMRTDEPIRFTYQGRHYYFIRDE